jgi:hypothetical protein
MIPEDILRAVHHKPFQPVRIHIKDGRTFDILHRNLIVVGRTYVDIGLQARGEEPGIADGIVILAPDDVIRVEPIAMAEAPPAV